MRDQIAALVKEIRYKPNYSNKQSWQFADYLLALIREDVRRVEGFPDTQEPAYYRGFEDCRQKLLALFKEDK